MTCLLERACDLLAADPSLLPRPARIGGWLTSCRIGKRVGFLVLSDGSSLAPLQVVLGDALLVAQPELRDLTAGCAVEVVGRLVASPAAGQAVELAAESVTVVGWVDDPEHYPIAPKPLSTAFLRTVPHLRHRVAGQAAVARLRHVLSQAIHDYLDSQGFAWVATPILTGSDAEGAGERFAVAGGEGFFGRPAHLTVSGQLEAEALAMCLGRVYAFGPTFRAEPSRTGRHLAEFWMVEPEWAFARLSDVMALAEGLVKHCIGKALERCGPELAAIAESGGTPLDAWQALLGTPFARVSYAQALALLEGSDAGAPTWGQDLGAAQEAWLVAHLGGPVFVVDYPADLKAFYMKASGDGSTVAAMDLLVPGVGELAGGSEREDDLARLRARMARLGMDEAAYDPYLDLRRCGGAPHAGFGLGLERLVAWVAGLGSVREAIAYPAAAGHLSS